MNDWPEVALSAVCEKPTYGLIARATDTPTDTRFIRQTDIVTGEVDWNSVPYCLADREEREKFSVREGDLLISRLGAGVGTAARVKEPKGAVYAGYLVRFRPNSRLLDDRFAGFLLHSPYWREHVLRVRSGAAQPTLNAQQMGQFTFRLPPISVQRRIAGVLGVLDDLIATNARLSEQLWLAAMAAYEVACEDSERVPMREALELRYGKALPARVRKPGSAAVVSSAGIVDSHAEALVSGPGVVVGRKGSVGTVTWVDREFFPIDTTFYVESTLPMLYCYFALRQAGLEEMNTDSAVPGLNRENALSRLIAKPRRRAMDGFVRVAEPLSTSASALDRELDDLKRVRDELLPLLLSGRVRVDEVAG